MKPFNFNSFSNEDKINIYHVICEFGGVNILKHMEKYGLDIVNLYNISQESFNSYQLAVIQGDIPLIDYLYSHECDSSNCFEGKSVYVYAYMCGKLEVVSYFDNKYPRSVDEKLLGFIESSYSDNISYTRSLIEKYKEYITRSTIDRALDSAVKYRSIEVFNYLYNLETPSKSLNEYFIESVNYSPFGYKFQEYLVNKGADIHYNNDTAFLSACNNGNIVLVEWLVEKGVNIRVNDDMGFNLACENNRIDVCNYLAGICNKYKFIIIHGIISEWNISESYSRDKLIKKMIKKSSINESGERCLICLDKVEIRTNCKHYYCFECFEKWLNQQTICTLCKQEFDFDKCEYIE